MYRPLVLQHFDFRALPELMMREGFVRMEGAVRAIYAGGHRGGWVRNETVWDEREGKYGFPGKFSFFIGTPGNLRVVGSSEESPAEELSGDELELGYAEGDVVARIPAGQTLGVRCEVLYQDATISHFRLVSCETGQVWEIESGGAAQNSTLEAVVSQEVAAGSYLLFARLGENRIVLDEERALVRLAACNETGFVASNELPWGEWAILRVVVGEGDWGLSEGVYPGVGGVLYRKTGNASVVITPENESLYRVDFDIAAFSVSASCVIHTAIRRAGGEYDVPEGSLVIAGLRASRSGPQSAIWLMREDGTARLLGLSANFSNGLCECGKSDHHASDVGQAPDGALYLLSECSLHRYAPDQASVSLRLTEYPAALHGHPGGQCLRFPGGNIAFWTENLTQGVDDGASWYNRLVLRLAGRDQKGPSSGWHGSNCAETYLGRFWSFRRVAATSGSPSDAIYLDWLESGRWHGFEGIKREANAVFWQRLSRCDTNLWLFGYVPARTDESGVEIADSPTCHYGDGQSLRQASVDYFVRRINRCAVGSQETLVLVARPTASGIGPARVVIELPDAGAPGAGATVCSFWSEDEQAFLLDRVTFESLGGDIASLPAFLVWHSLDTSNGGGFWSREDVAPVSGYWLQRDIISAEVVSYVPHSDSESLLPYSAALWGRLCFDAGTGDVANHGAPSASVYDAEEALAAMPPGTKFRCISRPVPGAANALTAFQVTDSNADGRLLRDRGLYPCLWARFDDTSPRSELVSYRQLVNYSRLELVRDVLSQVDVVVLVPPHEQGVLLPVVSRRA